MSDPVLYEQTDGVVVLTLNRPEKRNPISEPEMVEALVAAVARMNADRSVRAAILTGAGTAFSSGGDIGAMQQTLETRASDPVLVWWRQRTRFRFGQPWRRSPRVARPTWPSTISGLSSPPIPIPFIGQAAVASPEAAMMAARGFGGTVAVKADAPALVHKSDADAVRLGVRPDDAGGAYQTVVANAARAVGAGAVRGAVIQPMAPAGVEMLAGLRWDEQFGPTVTVGLGGIASEAMADVATELAPITPDIARDMLNRLRGARLLGPFRGAAPRDVEAMAGLLVALSAFAVDDGPALAELDLNPVILLAQGEGCVAVDAVATLR